MSEPVVFDSYPSGVTSVDVIFPSLPVETILDFETRILKPMVDAESLSDGRFVAIVIIGHADRQDDLDQFPTEEARRASELKASEDRAEDARTWLLGQFQAAVQIAGGVIPADWESARNVAVARHPCGAADLVHTQPSGESERLKNRRVTFFIAEFPKP